MATTPSTKNIIALKFTNAGASDKAIIQNSTQGWKAEVMLNAAGEALYNPATDGYTLSAKDKIYCYINGRATAYGSGTMSTSGITITGSVTVDTKSLAVNL